MKSRSIPVVIAVGGVITAVSLGARSTFGLYLDPVVDSLGTDRGTFALAVAVQNLMWGVSQPIAGAISDRYGAGRVLGVGAVLYSVALVLMASADSTGALFLSGGFLTGIAVGAASFSVVLSSVGRLVPPERRSVALGTVSAIGSLGQFVFVPLARWRLDASSWQSTLVVFGVLVLIIVLLAPWLSGRAADQMASSAQEAETKPLRSELRRAAHSRSYWLVNGGFFVCGFHVTFIGVHLVTYVEDLGFSGGVGATSLALIGLFNVAGSLAAGVLGATRSNNALLAGVYGARAVVIAAFLLIPTSSATILVFGALMGTLWLTTVPLTSAVVTKQFGPEHSGTLFGIVFFSHQIGAFIGAWSGGEVSDATGSYDPVWWFAVGLGVLGAVFHLLADEDPQPEPATGGTAAWAPAGAAVALTIGGVIGTGAVAASPGDPDHVATGGCMIAPTSLPATTRLALVSAVEVELSLTKAATVGDGNGDRSSRSGAVLQSLERPR